MKISHYFSFLEFQKAYRLWTCGLPAITAISLVHQKYDIEVVVEDLDLVWPLDGMRASKEVKEATIKSLTIQVHTEPGLTLVSIRRAY